MAGRPGAGPGGRSGLLESVHRGALVVLGAHGSVASAAGDVVRPVLPRSSNEPVQATAMPAAGWTPRSPVGRLHREHPLQPAIEARLAEAAGEPVAAVVVDTAAARRSTRCR